MGGTSGVLMRIGLLAAARELANQVWWFSLTAPPERSMNGFVVYFNIHGVRCCHRIG
jgi:hypothetical protein